MIAAFLYYGIIKPLSFLPLSLLYFLSDFLYFILYKVVGYRVKVVENNLKQAFPEKSEADRKKIMSAFYSHLCDLIVESIRLFSISKEEAIRRFRVKNPEILDSLYASGKNGIIVTGHYGNWEMGGVAFRMQIKPDVFTFYTQLSNPFFEKKFLESRTKYGCVMIPTKQVRDFYKQSLAQSSVSLYLSDQSPSNLKNVYWTTFLNQETAVAMGAERYAKEYHLPVYFGKIIKVKRGYYEVEMELICENPSETAEYEIAEKFTRKIEELIISAPQYWLWTHKRWKHKRQAI